MKTKLFISRLVNSSVVLGSIAIMSQSMNSVNFRLANTSIEHPSNQLSSQAPTKAVLLQANLNQPVTTAGISFGWVGGIFLVCGAMAYVTVARKGVIEIGSDEVGIVIKKFGLNPFSPNLPAGQLIALRGEAGPQAKVLTAGRYFNYFPQIYTIRKEKVIQIHPDEIGLVVAKDGANKPSDEAGQLFGKPVECDNFQNAAAFFKNGGQKGQQLAILKPGIYRINTELFEITKKPTINIPPDQIGLVVAKDGTSMPLGQQLGKVVNCNDFQDAYAFIEKGGEKGKQIAILKPGNYYINTDLFSVYSESVINIPQGEIGLIVAKDGAKKPQQQLLGKAVDCNNFQDACTFIEKGGQKGNQLAILASGTYEINTYLFTVITTANATKHGMKPEDLQVYRVEAGKIGIVTTYDGVPTRPDEIAGSPVAGHENFQDGQKFIDENGCRGLQEEILPPGAWNLNPWFVKVEQVELTDVPVGTVGVVISNVGKLRENNDGVVKPGFRGVWSEPLLTGKHVINTKVMNVEIVPTQPISLDWSNKQKPLTNYDASLNAIRLCSKDASFHFHVEVTQVISVPEKQAPTMIYRVGKKDGNSTNDSIKALIVKVLQPAVENYFRDSAQNSEALDFINQREDQALHAHDYIKSALKDFGVKAEKTLIGDIDLPDDLQEILKRRKKAEEERKTLAEERKTEEARQEFDIDKGRMAVEIAKLEAMAQQHKIDLDTDRVRRLNEEELYLLHKTIEIIGREGWLEIEKLKELVKLKLPEVYVSHSSDGGSGLMDTVLPQVLRTIRNSNIGLSNGSSTAYQAHKTIDTSSPSTTLPQG